MENSKDLTIFEPYIKALLGSFKPKQHSPDKIFQLCTSCKGVGNSRFKIVEQDGRPPANTCAIDIDKLFPNPPKGQKKCDHVFIILTQDLLPQGDASTYCAIEHLRYYCFAELKDSKKENYNGICDQIVATIELFRAAFKSAGLSSKAIPSQKIVGIICGGSPKAGTNFQATQQDFRKKCGGVLKTVKDFEVKI